MATKFIPLGDAAKMLDVSADELNEMRKKGEIHGLRDGASWKFKPEEVERVAQDRGISVAPAGGAADDALDLDGSDGDGSDIALGVDSGTLEGVATALGRSEDLEGLLDEPAPKPGGVKSRGAPKDTDLGLTLGEDEDSRAKVPSTDLQLGGSGSALELGEDEPGVGLSGTDIGLGKSTGSDLAIDGLEAGMSSDLTLDADEAAALGSKPAPAKAGGEEELALGDDEELVIDSGSDVTRGAGDTGINLMSPSDSGLNLEEVPMDLAGSSVSSLELPEDDEVQLDDLAGPDDATKLKADEEFQLEPLGGAEEEAEDSGSQVIALEDSEAFVAQTAAGVGEEAVLGTPTDELEGALEQEAVQPVTSPERMLYAPLPEMPYSVWNILTLLAIVLVLTVTGMLMTDLVRNMWSWDQTFSATTPIMDAFVQMFNFEP